MTYRSIGTAGGASEFVTTAVTNTPSATAQHFGAGGLPLSSSDYNAVQAAGGVLHVPLLIAKSAFFHSAPLASLNVTAALNLTACTLAGIFSGNINYWAHPSILATNRALNATLMMHNITIIARSDVSPSTLAVTQYLNSSCAASWQLGVGSTLTTWTPGTIIAPDTPSIVNTLSATRNAGSFIPWSIGFCDAAAGLEGLAQLTEVAVQTSNTTFITSAAVDPDVVAAAFTQYTLPAVYTDWSSYKPPAVSGPTGWPMPMVTYLYVRRNALFLAKNGSLLKALVVFALSDDSATIISSRLHIPFSASLRASLVSQVNYNLQVDPSSPLWTLESSGSPNLGAGGAEYVLSAYRDNWANNQLAELQAKMNVMTSLLAVVSANLSTATTSREQLRATSEANKSAAASAAKATSIAIAGVVLSVLLAALAILLAACYAHKTRVIDAKYRQVHSDC
ncbi:MAG: hypothetical protein WDW36_001298 [Sanguina aurantia]